MDAKVTLAFNKDVIKKAKEYADSHNMSLSRLIETLLEKVTAKQYASLEDLPVSSWVNMLAEGPAEYVTKPKSRAKLKSEYYGRKK